MSDIKAAQKIKYKDIPPPQELTVQAVRDFQVCGRFFDYRYNDKEIEPISSQKLMTDRFHQILTQVVSFFFYKKQGGINPPSYNALLNRWERMWFPKDFDAAEIIRDQHSNVRGNLIQYSNIAAAGLLKLYEDFADASIVPLLIEEKYVVPIAQGTFNENIHLVGTIDLVLRMGKQTHLYKWSTTKRRPSGSALGMEFAAQKMAMDYRGSKGPIQYHLYDLASSSPGVQDIKPDPFYDDSLQYWLMQARNEVDFVPRRGLTAYCKTCPFDVQCAKWSFKKEDNGAV